MLRTLGGKNVGKCRLRAHQHPLSPPLSNLLEPAPCKTSKARRVPGDVLLHASILDFKPKLKNRCMLFPGNILLRASILDFRLRLGNQCKETLKNSPKAASILDFKHKLGNRCSTIVVAVENGPPATAVAATIFRLRFKFLCSKEEWPACSGRSGNEFRGRF